MANSQDTVEEETEILGRRTVRLDIPARFQWNHDNGYCGEAAVQSIGLYYGAWISQQLIHDLNEGEYLLQTLSPEDHRDPLNTLTKLHFTYNVWDWKNSPQPQFNDFCRWMKQSILNKHPVVYGIFLPDNEYEDYDHIVPAVGIRYTNEDGYDENDELISYDLYNKKAVEQKMSEEEFGATRETIDTKENNGDGCIPIDIDYGFAITGIIDENHVTLPVHLAVSAPSEPNPAFKAPPRHMIGTVTISNLIIGNVYILLRYSSYEYVPVRGDENAFLESNFESRHQFEAKNTSYTYTDPKTIISTGSVYYRCIQLSD